MLETGFTRVSDNTRNSLVYLLCFALNRAHGSKGDNADVVDQADKRL